MDGSTGSRVRQAVVTNDNMTALRKELQFKEGEAFFAANAKDLPKESFNRKILVASHEQGRLVAEQELRKGKHPLEKLVLVSSGADAGFTKLSSIPSGKELPLSSLKEIFLPQLEIHKRHHGRVLFGTLCVQPFKLSSLISVLADKSGKAVRVCVFNLPSSQSTKEIEARFGMGLKVAIKEPYFKLCADGKVMVRVDNPADLVLVDDSNKEIIFEVEAVIQELDKIRTEGNRLFAQQNWTGAIEQYSGCIARCSTVVGGGDNEKIKQCLLLAFSNRSEVWLQVLNFKNALDDANKALEFDANHQKSISRRDRAWQGFGKVQLPASKVIGSIGKVQLPTSKANVHIEEPSIGEHAGREAKDVSKGKPRDVTPPTTASRTKSINSKDNPPSSAASKVKSTDSKYVSPPSTLPEVGAPDLKNNPPTKIKGADSKHTKLGADASKCKATERKSISPSPNASKVKIIEAREDLPAPSTPSKGKLSEAKTDPSSASKGKLSSSSKRKLAASAIAFGGQAPHPDSKGDPSLPESSKVKLTDGDDEDVPISTVNAGKSTDLRGDSSPLPRSSKAEVIDTSSTSPAPTELEELATPEPQNELAGVIDCEGPLFGTWLDSIRSSGDALLAQGKWVDAIRKYDEVTKFSPPKKNRDKVIQTLLLAYSHRSEAWIWLGNYENSLRDANAALEFVDRYPKSVVGYDGKHLLNEVRRGRAFHGLGEYEEACSIFTAALAKSPNEKSINDLLQKSRICYEQSRDGIYDLDEYFLEGCRGPPPPCSDFVGPVQIRRVLGKGRGLFLTRNVDAGDLLFVSNPLAVVRRRLNRQGERRDENEDYSFLTTKWRRNVSSVGLEDFVGRLALLQSKRKMYQLYSLTAGDPEEETEIPHINVFIPGSHFELPQGWENLSTDIERLRSIVILNAIDGGLNPLDGALTNQDDDDDEPIGCVGLWALPSFMNHSCVPNCHMIDVGNAMFVRASRNILEGEELTRAYFDVYQNGIDRQRLCEEWRFACNCERCSLEKALTAQRVLPLHEYRKLLERVREESLKRLHSVEKERSLSLLLPNPQPALLQLRTFADWFDRLLSQAEGLGNREKAWIGASHLEAYISRFGGSKDKNQFILALENMLEFMTNTAILGIGHAENALARASLLLEMVEDMYGSGSKTYRRIETRVLDLYGTAYGNLRKEVLLTMSRIMASASIRLRA